MVPVHLVFPLLAATLHVEQPGLGADLGVTRHSGVTALVVLHIGQVFEEARRFAVDFVQSSVVEVVLFVALLGLLRFVKIGAPYRSGVRLVDRGGLKFFAATLRCASLFSRLRVTRSMAMF